MKQFIFCFILLICFSSISFSQSNKTGLGIIVGEPTGVTFKYWLDKTSAIDAAAAWSFTSPGAFHIHADYLLHSFDLFTVSGGGRVPLYYGIGGRLKFVSDNTRLGIRVPVGLEYIFPDGKFDIFLEVVPLLDIAPETNFTLNAALGARYFF